MPMLQKLMCLQAQHQYLHHLHYFIGSYATVITANFSTVFVCMVILYWKIFHRIRRMRKTQGKHKHICLYLNIDVAIISLCTAVISPYQFTEQNETMPLFGATQTVILEGQKAAKKRVFLFLAVFFITGCMC